MERIWSLVDEPALHVRAWDDELHGIGFDERSGDTFVLGPLALEILAELKVAGAQTAQALVSRLSCGIAPSAPLVPVDAVGAELEILRTRGLVTRLSP